MVIIDELAEYVLDGHDMIDETEGTREDTKEHLTRIALLLRARTGHDIRGYKETTLICRIRRRMQVLRFRLDGVKSPVTVSDRG